MLWKVKKKKLRRKYLTIKEIFCDCECHKNKDIMHFIACCEGTQCPNCDKLLVFYYSQQPLPEGRGLSSRGH